MSEFSDRPFVAGSVTGLRAFRIDTLGRLTGVTHRDVWVPGENQAKCHKVIYDYFPPSYQRTLSPTSDPYGFMRYEMNTTPRVVGPAVDQPGHQMAGVECECGFYAYFDGGNDYLAVPTSGYFSSITVTAGLATASGEDKAPQALVDCIKRDVEYLREKARPCNHYHGAHCSYTRQGQAA